MALDFITTYFPDVADVSQAQLLSARQRLDTILKQKYPDLDTRPNSVFGDLGLAPYAYLVSAHEIAMERFMSDLDLEQVANGIIYNCFSRDTEFVSHIGVKSFQDFSDGDVITVLTHTGAWKPAVVRCHGAQATRAIKIRRGKLLYTVHATNSHRWLLRNGESTTSLKKGDMLLEAPCIFKTWDYANASVEERQAWAYGYVFGDGSVLKDANGNAKWSAVRLCGEKNLVYLDRFVELGFNYSAPKSFKGDVIVYTGSYVKEAPDPAVETPSFMQAFVRGYLDADGSRNYNRTYSSKRNNNKEFTKILATGKKHIDFVKNVFPTVGQYTTYTHELTGEKTNLGTRSESLDIGLNNYIYKQAAKFVVESISEETTVENVWCLEVEDDASFVLPFGLSTGNCDFVRKYIQNFATVDQTTLKSSGVIRLVFCVDTSYTIDRRARFIFGEGNEFTLRLANAGSLDILPVGSVVAPFVNQYALKQISETEYAIDIGVVGTMTTQVTSSTVGTTDYLVTDLTGVLAVTNFEFGLPPESLATLAAKTREAFYSATLTTRSGANNYLAREFPDLYATSPILPGDTAAIRAAVNPLGVANGKMDICVQSKNFGTTVSQTLQLTYSASGASGPAYYGKLDLLEVPQIIDSIQYSGDTSVVLGTKGPTGAITILSKSTDFAKAPLLTSAYSTYEDYWIRIVAPSTGGFDFNPINNIDGSQYNYFTVNYRSDPLVKVVSDTLGSSNLTPIGVDVLVKGYVPIYISSLLITYTRKAGVRVALETARTEIYDYFKGLGYNKIYAASKIYDAMYYAGADDVVSISVNSNIQWSIADKIIPASSTADPSGQTGFNIAYANSLPLPPTVYNNLSATAAFESTTYSVMEARNRGYYLPLENILFSEVIY